MGRTLKRVPLDYNAPLKQLWKGYENPYAFDCPKHCESGYSKAYLALKPTVPVFESLDALCNWAEENATVYSKIKATKEEWLKMLGGEVRF
jgi:hypothetical protein